MNGITSFGELMRGLEREEIRRELIKEWYQQRSKTGFTKPIVSRNN